MGGYATTRFRMLNRRIRLLVSPFDPSGRDPVPFVCECASERCFAPVAISPAEFDAICADDDYRLVAPGHDGAGEQVVVATPAYAVLRPAEPGEPGWSGTPAAAPTAPDL